jgi:hypothetical protein
MRHLKTAQDVVDTLGGLAAVCELTGANTKQAWNWVGRAEMFPACTYVVMQRALRRRGATAPAWLWNMRGVEKRAA